MFNVDEASRYKAVVKYLYAKCSAQKWLSNSPGTVACTYQGVLIRKSRGVYVMEPENLSQDLLAAAERINFEVAVTMSTETTKVIFAALLPQQTEILMPNGSQLQIVDSLVDIASGSAIIRKFQYAALLRQEQLLLLWHDDLDKILTHASSIEERLLAQIWGTGASPFAPLVRSSYPPSHNYSLSALASPSASITQFPAEVKDAEVVIESVPTPAEEEAVDVTSESLARPVVFTSSVYVGFACLLIIIFLLGFTVSNLIFETLTDGNKTRLALVACLPLYAVFSIFFAIVLFTDLFQAIGPISSQKVNSRFYSPNRPNLQRAYTLGFRPPHVTIQMPVYKESLEGVIIPTVNSLKRAISHYESFGGTANIFVNDDGMDYLDTVEANARVNFYHDNNIGWVSRPQNGKDGYVRKGKFKKASNMNFALGISCQVEDKMQVLVDARLETEKRDSIESKEQRALYQTALADTLKANPRAKASGDIRVGEHILLVDCDTRVPEDCLLYGAAEMFLSPEVAIVQHSCGVLQVTEEYFENGITFFTNLIYSAIRFAAGSGEPAPFVGHNAFLRWQAVQSVGAPTQDGYTAFWSESHVSEDFDLAMRLQIKGNICRLASYHGPEFMEGVSLTIYDELNRWEKYAYGCNELVFNPIWTWLWRGPFTKLFLRFLWADMQLSYKITVLGYISSYYALAAGLPFTIANYFLVGWFNGYLDKFYMDSWKVFLSLVLVFSIIGPVAIAVLRYRLGEKGLWAGLCENFKWMPMFAIFFGGMPFHLNVAILSHMFGIDRQWGATAKEKENSNFFKEIPKIFKRFVWMYAWVVPMVGGMVYLGCFAPRGWDITLVNAIVPMAMCVGCHALLPFVLNPSLMVFNY